MNIQWNVLRFLCVFITLPLGTWDWLQSVIVSLPGLFIGYFHKLQSNNSTNNHLQCPK